MATVCVLASDIGVRGLGQGAVHEMVVCVCPWLMTSTGQFWLGHSVTCVRCPVFSLEDAHFTVRQLALESNSVLSLPLVLPTVTLGEQG